MEALPKTDFLRIQSDNDDNRKLLPRELQTQFQLWEMRSPMKYV